MGRRPLLLKSSRNTGGRNQTKATVKREIILSGIVHPVLHPKNARLVVYCRVSTLAVQIRRPNIVLARIWFATIAITKDIQIGDLGYTVEAVFLVIMDGLTDNSLPQVCLILFFIFFLMVRNMS